MKVSYPSISHKLECLWWSHRSRHTQLARSLSKYRASRPKSFSNTKRWLDNLNQISRPNLRQIARSMLRCCPRYLILWITQILNKIKLVSKTFFRMRNYFVREVDSSRIWLCEKRPWCRQNLKGITKLLLIKLPTKNLHQSLSSQMKSQQMSKNFWSLAILSFPLVCPEMTILSHHKKDY